MCYPTGAFVRSESSPLQIAFLTGQSDPASCALSTEQGAFLRQLQGTGRQLVDCNYPYRRNSAPHRRTPLWRASLSNARQYLAARHARLAEADRKRVHALLDQRPMTLLLAGSCGLQLLTALQLPDALRARLAVLRTARCVMRPPCSASCAWYRAAATGSLAHCSMGGSMQGLRADTWRTCITPRCLPSASALSRRSNGRDRA